MKKIFILFLIFILLVFSTTVYKNFKLLHYYKLKASSNDENTTTSEILPEYEEKITSINKFIKYSFIREIASITLLLNVIFSTKKKALISLGLSVFSFSSCVPIFYIWRISENLNKFSLFNYYYILLISLIFSFILFILIDDKRESGGYYENI